MDKLGITVFDVADHRRRLFGALLGASARLRACRAVHRLVDRRRLGGAGNYAKLIQPEVEQLVGSTELAYFLAMLAVFVAALIVLVMLTNALSRSVRASPLAKPDRILGAGFGVLCAWVAVGTAFLFYGYLGPRALPPAVEGGATFPMIKEMANFVEPYLPPGFRTRLQGRERRYRAGSIALTGRSSAPAAPAAPSTDDAKPPETKPPQ